jgi:pimeloyl-ACP methyl ester carboxylesterase
MAPVARALADQFRVLEPLQRGSGGEPLTVAQHIVDLNTTIISRCGGARAALIGSSWGAMLALAFAAAHPDRAGPLVLVGCGTFDPQARTRLEENLGARIDAALQRRIDRLATDITDPDERLRKMGDLLLPAYSHDPVTGSLAGVYCDARAHRETWGDMLHLQAEGTYPAAFSAISSPVLMLHGAVDPHPGTMIRDSLTPSIPHLEYHEWQRCGHYPWLERHAMEEFFELLKAWLKKQC